MNIKQRTPPRIQVACGLCGGHVFDDQRAEVERFEGEKRHRLPVHKACLAKFLRDFPGWTAVEDER